MVGTWPGVGGQKNVGTVCFGVFDRILTDDVEVLAHKDTSKCVLSGVFTGCVNEGRFGVILQLPAGAEYLPPACNRKCVPQDENGCLARKPEIFSFAYVPQENQRVLLTSSVVHKREHAPGAGKAENSLICVFPIARGRVDRYTGVWHHRVFESGSCQKHVVKIQYVLPPNAVRQAQKGLSWSQ